MNKQRRKALQAVQDKLSQLKDELEALVGEEEEYRDNMPENFQGTERYERAGEVCNLINDALDCLDEAANGLELAIE